MTSTKRWDARLTEIEFAGKSLQDNFHELARLKHIPEDIFEKESRGLLESYETTFGESLPADAGKYILPAVKKLLDELARTDHIIALYTGDSRKIVDAVFKATGPGKYFKFRQYGTEVKTRADMVRLALHKAREITGQDFKDKETVIIGDSTRDIECGKVFNALTIAVATGFHSRALGSRARLPLYEPEKLPEGLKDDRTAWPCQLNLGVIPQVLSLS